MTTTLRIAEILAQDFPHTTSPNQVFATKKQRVKWAEVVEDDDKVFDDKDDAEPADDDRCDIHGKDRAEPADDDRCDNHGNDDAEHVLGRENRSLRVLRTNLGPKPWTKVR